MSDRIKFAIPTMDGQITPHFGHSSKFAIVETEDDKIINVRYIDPPVHQTGTYPRFLAGEGVDIIIAGGIGMKAINLFSENNIEVITGVTNGSPEEIVKRFLGNGLNSAQNLCDH